jgi:hypothetical protein
LAPTSAGGILNIGGTGGLVASGSTSEPQIFWQGRNGPLLRKQV